ncbi:hypothetical protein [Dactylosporangium sp. NPDC051541]|uniref:hypothetical protein n=1 Tax=Dactylosporangium sp. NPDC051541 TaxID=3363977 RepID=UPI0037A881BA
MDHAPTPGERANVLQDHASRARRRARAGAMAAERAARIALAAETAAREARDRVLRLGAPVDPL